MKKEESNRIDYVRQYLRAEMKKTSQDRATLETRYGDGYVLQMTLWAPEKFPSDCEAIKKFKGVKQ